MPVVEICKWTVSDLLASDPSVIKPALDLLVKLDGCLGVYHGLAEEDKNICHLVLGKIWDTYEHHEALMKHPEYPQVIGLEPSIGAGGIQMNHVELIHDFTPLLDAPCTEILNFRLKEGKSKEEAYGILQALVPKVSALNNKYAPGTWGQTREEQNKFYLIVGWDSMQAHRSIAVDPSLGSLIKNLMDSVTFEIYHVNLAKHA